MKGLDAGHQVLTLGCLRKPQMTFFSRTSRTCWPLRSDVCQSRRAKRGTRLNAAGAHRIVAQRRNNFAPTRPSESPTTTCTCGPTADVAAHGSVTHCSVVRAAFVRVALETQRSVRGIRGQRPPRDRPRLPDEVSRSQRRVRPPMPPLTPPLVSRADPDELIAGPSGCVHCFPSRRWPGFLSTNPLSPAAGSIRPEGYRQGLPPAGRIISGGHAARDAAHCSPSARQISAAASTNGRRATGGLRSGCHEIPSRRGGGSGRIGMTATSGSFSSIVRSGSMA